tara:strand:+ start:3530 stop:3883 length:354 start_codon:yes stop_codon:yes gene_type:complete
MSRFVATPEVVDGIDPWLSSALSATKENVELLTGTRNEADLRSRALLRGDVTVRQVGAQVLGTVTLLTPDGYTIGGVGDVAELAAFRALRDDVQVLANDLYYTRLALDLLIRNLTGA